MSRYGGSRYSDDSESDIDIHVSRRHASPARPVRTVPVQYVESRRRQYYDEPNRYLVPATERTLVTTRSRSRERRHRDSSPKSPPPQPIIINNHINNNSDSDSDSDYDHHDRHVQVAHHRSHSRADSSSYYKDKYYEREREEARRADFEREKERTRKDYEIQKKDYELDNTRKQLEEMKLVQKIEKDERRRNKTMDEERELRNAKKELEEIRAQRDREDNEKRIKQKLELERLRKEEEEEAEKKRRDKEAKEAVEKYKKAEAERQLKEKLEAEEKEREYKHRLQEQLLKSGLSEKEINAILEGKKVEKQKAEKQKEDAPRPTYTRMARRHLSLETLRIYDIEYQLDVDPEYVLIKRWVPESEQDVLWRHTKFIREQRQGKLVMTIDDKHKKKHHGNTLEPEFEWVRKKERKRSRSPSLLMYLAGGRPA